MKPRINFQQAAPDTIKAFIALETQIQSSGLEQSLIELVKTRASQINGCAYCINMHTQDARKRGETEQRLYLLDAFYDLPRLFGKVSHQIDRLPLIVVRKLSTLTCFHLTPLGSPSQLQVSINSEEVQARPFGSLGHLLDKRMIFSDPLLSAAPTSAVPFQCAV